MRVFNPTNSNHHLPCILLEDLLIVQELISDQMRKLASLPVHTNLVQMKRAAFWYLIIWSNMLFLLYLIFSVSKCTSKTESALIKQPVFTNLRFFFNLKWLKFELKVLFVLFYLLRFKLELGCSYASSKCSIDLTWQIWGCSFYVANFFVN